jgi:hypothetical protein
LICWSCPESGTWPVRFQTDLDVLAPLGDGPGNAALWIKDFTRGDGSRAPEAEAAMKRRVAGPGDLGLVLPPGDALLKEAEPWADQATMRFYPDVWTVGGFSTPIPDLLFSFSLAKSWVARAASDRDAPAAIEDCRRAIRWGRLLRQGDATVIQDLIGLASIRIGVEELYAQASRRGDQPLMLAAAIVQGETAPQRLRTAELATRLDFWSDGRFVFSDTRIDDWIGLAKNSSDRRFSLEAIRSIGFARYTGSSAQRQRAENALTELRASPDQVIAGEARWALDVGRAEMERSASLRGPLVARRSPAKPRD